MKKLGELIEGVRNCVVSFANVSEGDNVLVISETLTDPLVTQAFCTVAKSVGAKVTVVEMEPCDGMAGPPMAVTEAMKGADVAFGLLSYPSIWRSYGGIEAYMLYGTRYVSLATMTSYECLSSEGVRWPVEIYYETNKILWEKALKTKTVRVTCEKGTDLRAELHPEYISIGDQENMKTGEFRVFPIGEHLIYPYGSGDGTVVLDGFYMFGLLDEPLKINVKDGWIMDISGGPEAKKLTDHISGIENAGHLAEISWGGNPRMRKVLDDPTLIEAQRNSGVMHIGFGDSLNYGGNIPSKSKINGTILASPTIYFDDEIILNKGRLVVLDDPRIRKFTERFGNPNKLLADI